MACVVAKCLRRSSCNVPQIVCKCVAWVRVRDKQSCNSLYDGEHMCGESNTIKSVYLHACHSHNFSFMPSTVLFDSQCENNSKKCTILAITQEIRTQMKCCTANRKLFKESICQAKKKKRTTNSVTWQVSIPNQKTANIHLESSCDCSKTLLLASSVLLPLKVTLLPLFLHLS
jgi:hypothetical protein